jgi:hypothetical protein
MTSGVPVTRAVRRMFWDQVRRGMWAGDAAVAVGVSRGVGDRWAAEAGGVMAQGVPFRTAVEPRGT